MFAEIQKNLCHFSIKSRRFANFLNVWVFKKIKALEISVFPIIYNNKNNVDAIQHISILFNFFDFDLFAPAFVAFMLSVVAI